jgi:[amino group carrier protein]-lysine/ornithine hydrolase
MDDIALLEGLLKRYSPTLQESEAVSYLVAHMSSAGFQAFVDKAGNAVGTRGSGEHEILLLGHIDTVPGIIEVRREGDILHGRGAVDAKGPLACFTAAATRITPSPDWRITVIGAVGEEGNSHGAVYVRDHYQPHMLVIGEPSKWETITLGFKGSQWFNYHLSSPVAHTAGKAASACELAVQFWNRLSEWCKTFNSTNSSVFQQVTPTLRAMHSGTDHFTDTASLRVGLRLPPGLALAQVATQLEELKGEGTIELSAGAVEGYRGDKNNPLVRAFLQAIRKMGGSPGFSLKTGTSDMNIVAPVWNCPVVAYGPGDSSLDHTPEERVSVTEYLKSIDVLANVLNTLTQVENIAKQNS